MAIHNRPFEINGKEMLQDKFQGLIVNGSRIAQKCVYPRIIDLFRILRIIGDLLQKDR